MKTFIAWAGGIVVAVALLTAGTEALQAVGVRTRIDLDEAVTVTHGSGRYSYEEERDSFTTDVGAAMMVLAIMIGTRIGKWIYTGQLGGGVSARGRIQFRAVLGGVACFLLIGSVLDLLRGDEKGWLISVAHSLALLATAGGCFLLFKRWHDVRVANLPSRDRK
jgi:hypothetical protein